MALMKYSWSFSFFFPSNDDTHRMIIISTLFCSQVEARLWKSEKENCEKLPDEKTRK